MFYVRTEFMAKLGTVTLIREDAWLTGQQTALLYISIGSAHHLFSEILHMSHVYAR